MSVPAVPEHLGDHELEDSELAELWHSLCVELLDEEFSRRTHGSPRTYDAGCRGPMCTKGMRLRARRRTTGGANERYTYIDPILDHWCKVAYERIEAAKARILEQVIA